MAKLRLNKILAQAGLTSRRGADQVVLEGRVAVNGVVTREPGTLADPATDRITVDGRALPARESVQYLLLNKPPGVVTTVRDPEGRPVVTDLLPAGVRERVYPVGRLDADVEGVLLLTNDGALTHRLLHPRYAVPLDVVLVRAAAAASLLRLSFTEGRKHEVKRYCEALGHRVRRLRRIAFGPLALGALPAGGCRALTPREIASLRAAGGAPIMPGTQ